MNHTFSYLALTFVLLSVQTQASSTTTSDTVQSDSDAHLNPIEHTPISSEDTWVDSQHQRIEDQVDASVKTIDAWFKTDETNHDHADGTLRIYLDNTWNEYKGIETNVRVRGQVNLPNLSERINLVFGDDSLDDEQNNDITQRTGSASGNQKLANNDALPELDTIRKDAKDNNASIALRYAQQVYDDSGLDLDLGIRAGDDIYVRARLQHTKPLANNWSLTLEPTLRYGIDSQFYAQHVMNLDFKPTTLNSALYDSYSSQTLLRYIGIENDEPNSQNNIGLRWSQRYNLYKSFGKQKTLDYGVQVDGRIKHTLHSNLDTYGIYGSYRQPFLRDWFFIRSDLNYLKDRRLERDWHPSVFIRLETHF